MFYVLCRCCDSRIEVPYLAEGTSSVEAWRVSRCELCDAVLDYDAEDVREFDDAPVDLS